MGIEHLCPARRDMPLHGTFYKKERGLKVSGDPGSNPGGSIEPLFFLYPASRDCPFGARRKKRCFTPKRKNGGVFDPTDALSTLGNKFCRRDYVPVFLYAAYNL